MTPNLTKYKCTYSTQIRKKKNRVYQDGSIHINLIQKKISVYDERNMFIDSYMFLDMSTETLQNLEGESLIFEKCLVDVLEPWETESNNDLISNQINQSINNIEQINLQKINNAPLETKIPLKKTIIKKRNAPLVRMTKPLESIQDVYSSGVDSLRNKVENVIQYVQYGNKQEIHQDNYKECTKISNEMNSIKNLNSFNNEKIQRNQVIDSYNQSKIFPESNKIKNIFSTDLNKDIRSNTQSFNLNNQTLSPDKRSNNFLLSILEYSEDSIEDEKEQLLNTDYDSEYQKEKNLSVSRSFYNSQSNPTNKSIKETSNHTSFQQNINLVPNDFKKSFFDNILQDSENEENISNDEKIFEIDFTNNNLNNEENNIKLKSNNFNLTKNNRFFESISKQNIINNENKLEISNISNSLNTYIEKNSLNEDNQSTKHNDDQIQNMDYKHIINSKRKKLDSNIIEKPSKIRKISESYDIEIDTCFDEDIIELRPKKKFEKPNSSNLQNERTSNNYSKSNNSIENYSSEDFILRPSRNTKYIKPSPQKNFLPPIMISDQSQNNTKSISITDNVLDYVFKYRNNDFSLLFPDRDILSSGNNFRRCCKISNSFSDSSSYINAYNRALFEEMNLQIFHLAYSFRYTYNQISDSSSKEAQTPNCKKCGKKTIIRTVKKQNQNHGRLYYSCQTKDCNFFDSWIDQNKGSSDGLIKITDMNERKLFFRKNNIPYYTECKLLRSTKKSQNMPQWFLILEDKEKSSKYSLDDIWIISYTEEFSFERTIIARSLYHAPGTDGLLEVDVLYGTPRFQPKTESIFAIRGPNLSIELQLTKHFNAMIPQEIPLMNNILGNFDDNSQNFPFPSKFEPEFLEQKLNDTISEFDLNEDQASVLKRCGEWFKIGDNSENISLVHGAFGSGKSLLLTVVILFICRLLDEIGDTKTKILISSVTNVAVDNILRRLVDLGFEDFVRVGSQQKIAKDILPYTISIDKSNNAMIKELKLMLKEDLDEKEMNGVKRRLHDLQTGNQKEKENLMDQYRVTGVTCAASSFEILQKCTFSIIIQDESSQCIEPLSMLPISKFKCQKLIAVGDPQQLPPTLIGTSISEENSLEKPLFIRLMNAGLNPIILRTQYRCHPNISQISNTLFYQNKLLNGISHEDRAPLVGELPPIIMIDTINGKEQVFGDSYYNESEIIVISNMIQKMINLYGIAQEQIGVISLYKPQAFKLLDHFKKQSLRKVKVSTVDAFQGGEKDIIFLSCVRTEGNSNQFLESEKRLNVAFTRAKHHLIAVGKQSLLIKSQLWRKFIENVMTNGLLKTNVQILSNDDLF